MRLKIGQRVYFLVTKLTRDGKRNKQTYAVESGEIQSICDNCAAIKSDSSFHNRSFDEISLSPLGLRNK